MRSIVVLPLIVLLSACGGSADRKAGNVAADPDQPKRSVSSELPKGVKPSNEVLEARKIAGVWRSAPGVLETAPKQTVQIEIAFDKTFTMTLWGKDPKGSGQAVFARQSGRLGRTRDGIAGSTSDAKASALRSLASWSASLDKQGVMVLNPSGGRRIELRKTGN